MKLGNKEYKIKSNWLRITNKLFDIEKIEQYIKKILPFIDSRQLANELNSNVILEEQVPEYAHILGERIKIYVDKNYNVLDICSLNHEKRYYDSWGAFSVGTEVPFCKLKDKIKKNRASI